MINLLRRLSTLSHSEYGLIENLIESGLLPRGQISLHIQQVVDDRLALSEAYIYIFIKW